MRWSSHGWACRNLERPVQRTTLEGATQTIALGPVASQLAIKQLGTNGGGFFNVNSAHPFKNPTALTNLLSLLAILAISAAFTFTFGRIVGDRRQGWALFAALGVLFVVGFVALNAALTWDIDPPFGE